MCYTKCVQECPCALFTTEKHHSLTTAHEQESRIIEPSHSAVTQCNEKKNTSATHGTMEESHKHVNKTIQTQNHTPYMVCKIPHTEIQNLSLLQ